MIIDWLLQHGVEVLGALLGVVYIFLSIKQNIWTWGVGLLSSILYVYVYFTSKFYADMGLQMYYVAVSIYGWYFWLKGNAVNQEEELKASKTPKKYWIWIVLASVVLFLFIHFVLRNYTDSPVPVADSVTTALSVVATWMLARKYVEQWLFWVFIDAFSAYLYAIKGLFPTVLLFVVYTVMAIVGYFKWMKEIKEN